MSTLHEQLGVLAAHVRDPQANAGPPGIESRRLKIYSDLVFNNLDGLLAGGFPVIRKTLGDADWHALLRRFLVAHHSRTPLFTELGREFIAFLEAEAAPDPARPWLAELAHYEWAELGLQLSEATPPTHDPNGDLLAGIPVLSPLAWPLAYRWPVDRIGPDFQPTLPPPEPTLILLRREADGRIHFSKLSPLLYRLLELVETNISANGCELLRQLAHEAGQPDFDAFLHEATPMLQRLHDEGVLIGTRIA
ncbi:MAG: putative DNA-binding domain-containing protein [Thermomonas sp.]|uniref:HvfC family RiPP maturation protein n=1 Tax=Thermomonas sp. TaxID=1971895 RepID=UPI0039E641F9